MVGQRGRGVEHGVVGEGGAGDVLVALVRIDGPRRRGPGRR